MSSATVTLRNGAHMPVIGLGTWKSAPNVVGEAVRAALEVGYKHIDCAAVYNNEAEVGQALAEAFTAGIVKREELFITSKVFNQFHGEKAVESLNRTLADLRLDYVDLLLIHWPVMFDWEGPLPNPLRQPNGHPNPLLKGRMEYVETWKVFERLLAEGRVRNIGVSNFTVAQLEELARNSTVVPAVNQVEGHPYLQQPELIEYCKSHGIVVTAYSPLGSPDSYAGSLPGAPALLKDERIAAIAAAHSVSPAQVLIRWAVQRGTVVIPKASARERIAQNLAAVTEGADLTAEEMSTIAGLERGHRYGMGWMPGHFLPE